MDEERRRAYLAAMEIPLWRTREASPPVAVPKGSLVREPSSIEGAREPVEANSETMSRGPSPDPVAALDWAALEARVAACEACPDLVANRSRTVFGVGDRHARLMLIGEAPGADEDRLGEPFVGRAGKLLDNMLRAIGLDRRRVFIANILKCRPPGNRDPKPGEAANCFPFLERQVQLIAPRLLLSLGRISAQTLLRTQAPVGRLRGRVHELEIAGLTLPLVVTYHPAYLLRSPEQKAKSWDDLRQVWRLLQAGEA